MNGGAAAPQASLQPSRASQARLRANALASFAATLAALAIVAWVARAGLPLTLRFPLVAGVVFAGIAAVALERVVRTHPFDRFGTANQVTTLRAALVALAAGLVGEPRLPAIASMAAVTALVVTTLDFVDGRLARRSRMASPFGAWFDLEIDALLIMVLALLVWQHEKAGGWVVISGLLRYLFAAAGLLWRPLQRPLPPSLRRQAICVVQIWGLMVAILPFVAPPVSNTVAALSLGALCYSFTIDIVWLVQGSR